MDTLKLENQFYICTLPVYEEDFHCNVHVMMQKYNAKDIWCIVSTPL